MNEGNLYKGIGNYSDAAQSVVQVHFLVPAEHKTSNNHATFMNQKVVTQNFIIEPTCDKYFTE